MGAAATPQAPSTVQETGGAIAKLRDATETLEKRLGASVAGGSVDSAPLSCKLEGHNACVPDCLLKKELGAEEISGKKYRPHINFFEKKILFSLFLALSSEALTWLLWCLFAVQATAYPGAGRFGVRAPALARSCSCFCS